MGLYAGASQVAAQGSPQFERNMDSLSPTNSSRISERPNLARPYQICTSCVMDTHDPAVRFNAEGVCHHCTDFEERRDSRMESGDAGEKAFDRIVTAMKAAGEGREYDCVVGISGGV